MELTGERPTKKLGDTLNALLEEVLDNPEKNTPEYMEKRAVELMNMSLEELDALGKQGKEKREKEEAGAVAELHKKHNVN
jgi:hypothetical protein